MKKISLILGAILLFIIIVIFRYFIYKPAESEKGADFKGPFTPPYVTGPNTNPPGAGY